MAVSGVGFVGLRSDQFSEMVSLFRDVIGVPIDREAIGMAGFRLNDGTVLEIIGPGRPPTQLSPVAATGTSGEAADSD